MLRYEYSRPDDITVLIGVRNRSDYRIVNALRTIREQTYPRSSVRVMVIDYGSEPESARELLAVSREHDAEYVRVDDAPVWSRSRCLNVGIRRSTTKFLMACDADILLSPGYIADTIHVLRNSALSVICSPMLDLPEESVESLRRSATSGKDLELERWKKWCLPRHGWRFHPSIATTYSAFYQLIRGYDEYYEVWGSEDNDLMRRFRYLGLCPTTLDTGSFYLHQWHSRFEGVSDRELEVHVERNRAHYLRTHAIIRNDCHWGRS